MTWTYQTQAAINTTHCANHVHTQHGNPVATYLNTPFGKARRQITSAEVATFLQNVLHKTFNTTAWKPDLTLCSCHSI